MTKDEMQALMDYWDDEIQRSQYYIYECQENIQKLKEQMSNSEGWDG